MKQYDPYYNTKIVKTIEIHMKLKLLPSLNIIQIDNKILFDLMKMSRYKICTDPLSTTLLTFPELLLISNLLLNKLKKYNNKPLLF